MKIEVGDYFQICQGDVFKIISKPTKNLKKFKIKMLSYPNLVIETSHYWVEEGVTGKHIKKLSHLQGELYEN